MKRIAKQKTPNGKQLGLKFGLPKVISFRPAAEDLLALVEHADEEGTTPHSLAHRLVVEALYAKDDKANVLPEIHNLRRQLFELREEMALVTEMLLVSAGKLSADAAQKWVDKNMKP